MANFFISPQNSCDKIMAEVHKSKLHYLVQESPFSIYLTLRKKFTPEAYQANNSFATEVSTVTNISSDKLAQVIKENASLKTDLENVHSEFAASKDIIEELESKIDSAESSEYKHHKEIQQWKLSLEKKEDEVIALNKSLKANNQDISTMKGENNQMKKVLKAKEKEIYNLDNVNLNQLENIRRIKEDSKKLKVEKTNLEKQLKKFEKKKS